MTTLPDRMDSYAPKVYPDHRWRWMMFRRDVEKLPSRLRSVRENERAGLILLCFLMEFYYEHAHPMSKKSRT